MGRIYKMSETSNTTNIISGIYKLNFPNGKCYIGLSNNIRKRVWKHNHDDYKLGRIVGYAIHKYGELQEFEVLEEISPDNRELMNEKEKYWIKFFHSNEQKFGYNMTNGGDGGLTTLGGVNAPGAYFNQEQLNSIIDLLQNHREISMKEIAQKYQVNEGTISSINVGNHYKQENIKYPIRTQEESNKMLLTGTKSSSSKLDDKQLAEIIEAITNSSLSFAAIAKKYKVSPSTIGLINKGKRYYNNNLIYPLRNKDRIKQIQYTK